MKKYLLFIVSLLSSVMMFSSCNHDEESQQEWPESNHTYFIYMIGDNSLSSWCKTNTELCIKALLKSETPVNLVIYEDGWNTKFGDSKRGTPALYRLKRNYANKEKVDTIMIHQFETDHDSTDPAIMKSIINEAFESYPGQIKGLEIWSHGLGWAPSSNYSVSRAMNAETRATQWIGQDDDHYLEIWQLREVLEECPHLDYIAFDACNMSQAEVAYELRNVADYMLACPTEIMAEGLPYLDMIQSLSAVHTTSALTNCFSEITHDFEIAALSSGGGTFAVLNLKEMTTLHQAYRLLLAACPERLQLLKEKAYVYEDNIQQFGRAIQGSAYLFYDMLSVADFLSENNTELPEYLQLKEALSKVVIDEYHSGKFLDMGNISSCGLGVGLPEVFGTIATNKNKLLSAYDELQWSRD